MKINYLLLAFLLSQSLVNANNKSTTPIQDSTLSRFFKQTKLEINIIQINKYNIISVLNHDLNIVNNKIERISKKKKVQTEDLINAILQKDRIREKIRKAELVYEIETSKIRYKKGFDLIK